MTEAVRNNTRPEAIAAGLLIDVTPAAKKAGIHHHTAITPAVWKRCVEIAAGRSRHRRAAWLGSLVWFLRCALTHFTKSRSEFKYQTLVPHGNWGLRAVWLKAVWGADEAGEPAITLMMPEEGEEIRNRNESSTEGSGHE